MRYSLSKKPLVMLATASCLLLALVFLIGEVLAEDRGTQSSTEDNLAPLAAGPLSVQEVISPTSHFVLFQEPQGITSTIWLLTEGITQTLVISGMDPRLSPDGRYMLYKWGAESGWYSDVYVRDLQTNISTMIFDNDDFVGYYAWTSDGSKIFLDYECHIYSMNPDGSGIQEIIGDWPDSGIDYCYNDVPDVNPIDGRVVWENWEYGIGIADADGSNPSWVPNTIPGDYGPRWSSDGQWIAFYRDEDAQGDDDNLYKVRPDGSDFTQLTFLNGDDESEMEYTGAWTPDGKYHVAGGTANGVDAIYAIATDGSGRMLPVLIEDEVADNFFVGNVGNLAFSTKLYFLPLTFKNYAP